MNGITVEWINKILLNHTEKFYQTILKNFTRRIVEPLSSMV
jgi:hypothetical protein